MTTATKTEPTQAEDSTAKPSGRGWILFAAVIVIAAIGGTWYYREHASNSAHSPDAHGTAHSASSEHASHSGEPIPVQTVRVTKGGIVRTSSQVGTVEPFEQADLYAKISGYLANLHVDYGDHVKQGQLLVEIDDPEIIEDAKKAEADVIQAKAAVAQAEAFIESAKADRDAAMTTVDQSIAEVDRYKSMRLYHEKKFARYRELVQNKAIPQQIADEEEEGYESARASEVASEKAVLNSRAQLVAANARVKKTVADLAEAKANVEVAQAKLSRANVLVGYTKIKSPYSGVITKRNFFRGAFIRSASEGGVSPLLTVARTDKVRVVTQVPDRDVPFTSVGDTAEVTLDALSGQVFKGKVARFAETEDPTSRTMHTEIDLDNAEDKLRPGMYGIAKIILDTPITASTLPATSLVGESKEGKADIYVIRDGKAKKVQIAIGADDGLRVEVLSGISPTDEVIVTTGSIAEGVPVLRSEGKIKSNTAVAKKSADKHGSATSAADNGGANLHH